MSSSNLFSQKYANFAKGHLGLSELDVLREYRNKHYTDSEESEAGACARAIDEVAPKLQKMDHIKMVEYIQKIGPYREKRAAVFDDRRISEKEVRDGIVRGETYNPNVIFMTLDQFYSVFK